MFKVLLGALSPGMNPKQNLDLAIKLYDVAKAVHPNANPLSILPFHQGVNRVTGESNPAWGYLKNERLPLDEAIAIGYDPSQKRASGADEKPPTRFMSPKVAIDSYLGARKLLQKLYGTNGNEEAVRDFFLMPQSFTDLARHKKATILHKDLPRDGDIQGTKDRYNKEYEGAWLFGPKAGPFVMNVNYHHGMITKDLWFSRSWNRLMGTLYNEGKLKDVPRGPEERGAMDESVHRMAEGLGLTPSELQAAWWYYEQGLYRSMGAKAPSNSFAEAIDAHLAKKGIKLPYPKLASEDQARRRKAVERAKSTPLPYSRPMSKNSEAISKYPRPARDVFESLRADAEDLIRQGKMPDLESFLTALVQNSAHVANQEAPDARPE
jgi:hypothetical protein